MTLSVDTVVDALQPEIIDALRKRGYLAIAPGDHLYCPYSDTCLLCGQDLVAEVQTCDRGALDE